mmetsp:Transcript_102721/g.290999  ORF Transcript_102721/g.290999 Transcript_102721/m.290999 type:complete len:452 (-) Transcript_102721:1398-2753(-)
MLRPAPGGLARVEVDRLRQLPPGGEPLLAKRPERAGDLLHLQPGQCGGGLPAQAPGGADQLHHAHAQLRESLAAHAVRDSDQLLHAARRLLLPRTLLGLPRGHPYLPRRQLQGSGQTRGAHARAHRELHDTRLEPRRWLRPRLHVHPHANAALARAQLGVQGLLQRRPQRSHTLARLADEGRHRLLAGQRARGDRGGAPAAAALRHRRVRQARALERSRSCPPFGHFLARAAEHVDGLCLGEDHPGPSQERPVQRLREHPEALQDRLRPALREKDAQHPCREPRHQSHALLARGGRGAHVPSQVPEHDLRQRLPRPPEQLPGGLEVSAPLRRLGELHVRENEDALGRGVHPEQEVENLAEVRRAAPWHAAREAVQLGQIPCGRQGDDGRVLVEGDQLAGAGPLSHFSEEQRQSHRHVHARKVAPRLALHGARHVAHGYAVCKIAAAPHPGN